MPNLGKKFECYNCRTKFYDLGKPEAICPKCGANQKDALRMDEGAAPAPRPRRIPSILIPPEEGSEFEGGNEEEEEAPVGIAAEEFVGTEGYEDEEIPIEPRPAADDEEESF